MLKLNWIVVASLFFGLPVSAETFPVEIDEIFSMVDPKGPGCAVGAEQAGRSAVKLEHGLADLERQVPITERTVFDAGSVQKQFVAAAILLLVEDGKLALEDDVRDFLPELPDYGSTITIDHLLTHTSGVRDWTFLELFMGGNQPILDMIFAQQGLNFTPGDQWSYSNSDYVLLKEIIERASGVQLARFAQDRLFLPLGMTASEFIHDLAQVIDNRALAYERSGDDWTWDMRLDDDRGGGVLFTTAGDLLTWNQALNQNTLGSFVSGKLQEPARLNNGRVLDYGRGLMIERIDDDPRILMHSGGAGGYSALVARFLREDISIAILCNGGETSGVEAKARAIVKALVANDNDLFPDEQPEPQAEIDDAGSIAGMYLSADQRDWFELLAQDGKLRFANGPELVATGENQFELAQPSLWFRSQNDLALRILTPETIEITSMEGVATRYHRAIDHEHTAAELQALAGTYENKDMGVELKIAAEEDTVTASISSSPSRDAPLRPVAHNVFQLGPMHLFFEAQQGTSGAEMVLSTPTTNGIPFRRLAAN